MSKFPNTPAFTGFNTPVRFEGEVLDLEVEGEIPADLDGAFYRVQPDPQFPPKLDNDIAFNGDGAISMFRFKNGKVDFKQRWVRTDKFDLEREAGHALFGAYRNPLTDDESVKGRYRGTANTNIFGFGDTLYALKEDSPAVAMDPVTLETRGYTDFGGQVTSPTFTAHPKIDPVTGDMCAFGYAAKGLLTRDVVYYEISPDGKVKHQVAFEAPYYCMMHDFGVTQDYAVFHIVPCVGNWDRLEKGMPHFGFDTTKEIYLGVLPRKGDARDMRWFKGPNLFASHVMNAFNDGTKVHFDTPVAKNNMFPFFPDVHGAPFKPQEAASHITRWTIDMASNSDTLSDMVRMTDLIGEFPRIDDRYATNDYRHGWMLVQDFTKPFEAPGGPTAGGMFMNMLGHLDHSTGRNKTWWPGPLTTLQEPCFIPKSANSPEGEGYIVQVANRLVEKRSDLLLFDAQHIDEGPIATAKLPIRLRSGLHGNFISGAVLAAA